MRRVLCENLFPNRNSLVEIPESESKHLISVLRLGPGDIVELMDGNGSKVSGKLVIRDKHVFAELTDTPQKHPELMSLPIHLRMAILKGDAMEWVIEKAVELGVRSLTPIETEFTVVKIHKKGAESFQERWQKIADQALKQCGRVDRMFIHPPLTFDGMIVQPHRTFWLDEALAQGSPENQHFAKFLRSHSGGQDQEPGILVGPEGGFSPNERNRLLQLTVSGNKAINRVHLGSLILRAETAALLGVSLWVGEYYGKR